MLANWVKEAVTGTPGGGNISLAGAVTGFIAFTTAFKDQQLVHYSIEDGNNREIGIGTFTTSGAVLARSIILETLVSGTHDNLAPTAVTLTSAAIVSCTPSANSLLPATDYSDNAGTDNLLYDVYLPNFASSKAARALFNNRTYLMPFYITAPVTLSGLGVEILTLAAGAADQELGLYIRDTTDNSFTLLDRTGNVDISSAGATGFISTSFDGGNLFLSPGMYWIGQTTNVSTGSIQGFNFTSTGHQHPYTGQKIDEPIMGVIADGTYASGIPATIATGDIIYHLGGLLPLLYGVKV